MGANTRWSHKQAMQRTTAAATATQKKTNGVRVMCLQYWNTKSDIYLRVSAECLCTYFINENENMHCALHMHHNSTASALLKFVDQMAHFKMNGTHERDTASAQMRQKNERKNERKKMDRRTKRHSTANCDLLIAYCCISLLLMALHLSLYLCISVLCVARLVFPLSVLLQFSFLRF